MDKFLLDWGVTFAIGGGVCLLFGFFAGWIIWKNTRKLMEKFESGNRHALADFETTSDEVSRIRAELSGRGD